MRLPLRISILLNVLLLGSLAVLFTRVHVEPIASRLFSQETTNSSKPSASVQSTPVSQRVRPEPFRWSQLEPKNDYQEYVANLRAVGCPESTIRAIVSADVEAAFAFKRRQLPHEDSESGPFSLHAGSQLVANLLAKRTANAGTSIETAARSEALTRSTSLVSNPVPTSYRPQTDPIFTSARMASAPGYPLAFQNTVVNDTALNADQKATINQVQQQFVQDLGATNRNPGDPAYFKRWQSARNNADDLLRAKLGVQAYIGYQLQHYYENFKSVILNSGGGPVTIDPDALAK